MNSRRLAVFLLILFFDFSTKYWVSHNLPLFHTYYGFPFGGIGLIHWPFLKFSIVHTTNTGTAWGLLANYQGLLLAFRLMITGALLAYLIFFKPAKHFLWPLTCICAGAVGNILDFFLYGHVIDMFYFIIFRYSFPIFNIADSAIFLSVVYLLLNSKKIKFRRHAS